MCTVLLKRQPHEDECQSLCSAGTTPPQIKQLEVERGDVPQCPIAGDVNGHCGSGSVTEAVCSAVGALAGTPEYG